MSDLSRRAHRETLARGRPANCRHGLLPQRHRLGPPLHLDGARLEGGDEPLSLCGGRAALQRLLGRWERYVCNKRGVATLLAIHGYGACLFSSLVGSLCV